jgi:hypothetical protein
VQISTLVDHHRQVSAARLRLRLHDVAHLLQATTGQAEILTLIDQEACRDRGLLDDIELALDLCPPGLGPHREGEVGDVRSRRGMLVLEGDGAGATAATAAMTTEVEVEVVVTEGGVGVNVLVV